METNESRPKAREREIRSGFLRGGGVRLGTNDSRNPNVNPRDLVTPGAGVGGDRNC